MFEENKQKGRQVKHNTTTILNEGDKDRYRSGIKRMELNYRSNPSSGGWRWGNEHYF